VDRIQAYVDIRTRLIELGRSLDDAQAAAMVAACPKWTVKDAFAHLVGNNADGIAGRMDGVTQDWWTQRQVDERSGHTLAEVLDEWDELSPAFEAGLRSAETVRPELIMTPGPTSRTSGEPSARPGVTTLSWSTRCPV